MLIRFIQRIQGHRNPVMHEFISSVNKVKKVVTKVNKGRTAFKIMYLNGKYAFVSTKSDIVRIWNFLIHESSTTYYRSRFTDCLPKIRAVLCHCLKEKNTHSHILLLYFPKIAQLTKIFLSKNCLAKEDVRNLSRNRPLHKVKFNWR